MEKRDIQERFWAFLKGGKISLSEDKELRKMLLSLDKLTRQEYVPNHERIWRHIHKQIVTTKKHSIRRRWIGVAAVLLPALIGSLFIYYFPMNVSETVSAFPTISRDQVQLFLPGDRVIYVQQIAKDSVLHEEEVGIWLDTTNLMVYTPKETVTEKLIYNTLNVPRCCEYHMVLADGTEVWLNSESELRFPVRFVENERRVYLKGEAYFQVAQDSTKPFRVEAQGLEVEALGTAFDVNVYRDAGKLSTTLLNGAVKVTDLSSDQTCELKPGEQAVLQDWKLSIGKVNVQEVISWKNGRFVFTNMMLEEIVQQLERWYDVKIEFQDIALRYHRFTGVIKRYHELKQLIDIMEETTAVKFQIKGQKITIYKEKEKRQPLQQLPS